MAGVELSEQAKRRIRDGELKGVLGKTGGARKTADRVTKRKGRNQDALEMAMQALRNAQSTDNHQG